MDDTARSDGIEPPTGLGPGAEATLVSQADFEMMLRAVVGQAYGVALRLTGNRQDAEDLVQDAALAALRGRSTFRAGSNFRAWFFKIVMNRFFTAHRKRRPVDSIEDIEEVHPLYLFQRTADAGLLRQDDPVQTTIGRLAEADVAAALASLPDEFRAVCTMYFMDDFSYEEIADMLDIPIGTVRSRLHRGRRLLQKRLWQLAVDQGIVPDVEQGPKTGGNA
jgi:RNA polymerase sigma-70 factor (ECF subfamily)